MVRPDRLAVLDGALAAAHAGRAHLLCIEGEAGTGKTTHLRALARRADGFRILSATAHDAAYRPAHGMLAQLGMVAPTTGSRGTLTPIAAAQALRRLIDAESRDGPLLLVLDDVQWADEESLDALRLVLGRVMGDRLLVAVANRAFPRGTHRRWQRHRSDPGAATILALDGLDLAESAALIRDVAGVGATASLLARLHRHTGGNPMHLRSLVSEYSLDRLAQLDVLPAPLEVARDLDERLEAMDPAAARLLRAIAVVGPSWVERLDAAAIAGIEDSAPAVDLLLAEGLVRVRAGGARTELRVVHALVHAALYQSLRAEERRELHHRAAQVLRTPTQRLEHAVAAAQSRDHALARMLRREATQAHEGSDFRREALLLGWVAQVAVTPAERERAWLESQIATLLARDTGAVRAHLAEIGWARDVALRTVTLAWLLVVENRIADARRTLEAVPADVAASADGPTRVRLLVLTAWTMLVSGYPTEHVRAVLEQLPAGEPSDPALRGYFVRTAGQIAARGNDFDHIQRDLVAVPEPVGQTSLGQTDRLAWRGAVYSLCGFATEARRDLGEVVSRIRGGRVDGGSGTNHALYAFALWQDGEFDRAGLEFQAALDLAPHRPYPLVQAALPLVPAVRGDLARADVLLAESDAVLRDLPWPEAIAVHVQAVVTRLHAGDDDDERARGFGRIRAAFGADFLSPARAEGALWHLHVALARIWAGELAEVPAHLDAIDSDLIVPRWARWARAWLTGLQRERSGDLAGAHEELLRSAGTQSDELPLLRAHLQSDLARVAGAVGDADGAAQARKLAQRSYARLGARAPLSDSHSATAAAPGPLRSLSEREREVAALVRDGLSYAQIAEELYVTRSTVAFHLGNIYAKIGVGSRHELASLLRGEADDGGSRAGGN